MFVCFFISSINVSFFLNSFTNGCNEYTEFANVYSTLNFRLQDLAIMSCKIQCWQCMLQHFRFRMTKKKIVWHILYSVACESAYDCVNAISYCERLSSEQKKNRVNLRKKRQRDTKCTRNNLKLINLHYLIHYQRFFFFLSSFSCFHNRFN